jgi:hypothetical protein
MRGVISGGRSLAGAHVHLTITAESAGRAWSVEYEIIKGSHGPMPKGAPTLDMFFDRAPHLFGNFSRDLPALVTANLALSSKSWESIVPLPLTPPGALEKMPGAPQISGIDFSFSDRSGGQKLRRAFVTTYDAIDEIVVRLLLAHPFKWGPHITHDVFSLISQYLPSFVRPRSGSKSDE